MLENYIIELTEEEQKEVTTAINSENKPIFINRQVRRKIS